jgi:hypothetical protein
MKLESVRLNLKLIECSSLFILEANLFHKTGMFTRMSLIILRLYISRLESRRKN